MKELTIEEKAKRYDEAIKVAQRFYNNSVAITKKGLEDIFPELKESEDEKWIPKEIAKYLKEKGGFRSCWLAWLEKQCEQPKKHDVCDNCDQQGCYVSPCSMKLVEKQGEQKPIPDWMPKFLDELRSKKNYFDWDEHKNIEGGILAIIKWMNPNYFNEKDGEQKVEPKFKVGDTMRTLQEAKDGWTDGMPFVVSIDSEYYNCNSEKIAIKDQDKYEYPPMNRKYDVCDTCDEKASCINPCPTKLIEEQNPADKVEPKFKIGGVIIKKHNSDILYFCSFTITDITGGKYWYNDRIICDITEQDDWELYEPVRQNTAWSEEDEYYLNSCITKIEIDIQNWEGHGKTMIDIDKEIISWLKSLKDRVQPQPRQEWSEDDERLFQIVIDILDRENHLGNISHTDLIACVKKLKSLRPQSQWKPSEGQLEALKKACDKHWEPDGLDPLYTLYQDLKKLK